MKTRTMRRLLTLAAASLAAAAIVSACSGKKSGSASDPRCDEAVAHYQGSATDEGCRTMLDAEDAGQVMTTGPVPVIVSPSNGQTIAMGASALNITWTSSLDLDGDALLLRHRPAAPSPRGFREIFLELLSPESTAWAHLPPLTGALHMIRIKGVSGQTPAFLAFTTRLHFAVTGSNLAPILATTTPMQIELTDAYLTENRIANPAIDGPFRAADRSFHVQ